MAGYRNQKAKVRRSVRKVLGGVLLLLGLAGLLCGWLGETVWAPSKSHTAIAQLNDPGVAVVIEPGVLYIGGKEGTVTVKGEGEISLITATPADATAYLDGVPYTAITGADTWKTLTTQKRNADGDVTLDNPTKSDLWHGSTTVESPAKLNISEWATQDLKQDVQRPYRALVIVSDGKKPAASEVSIEWPSDESNAWVPYAYAAGAVLAVIGLVILLMSLRFAKDRDEPVAVEGTDDAANEPVQTDLADTSEGFHRVPDNGAAQPTRVHGRRRAVDRGSGEPPTNTQEIDQ